MTVLSPVSLIDEPFENTTLFRFPKLAAMPGLVHVVTSKPWNMAPHRGPEREHAVERRRRLCEHLGMDFERLTVPEQIHSPHVIHVRMEDVGAGRLGRQHALKFVDGLVCNLPGVPLLQLSADCPLVMVYDPRHRAIGTAHASWRGTVAGITRLLVELMVRAFDCRLDDLHAAICPCAGPDRYEVGVEVWRVAEPLMPEAHRFFRKTTERMCFDLRAANADQLLRAGVPAGQIEIADICTISDDRFYSHRREGDAAGRFALLAACV